MLHSNPVHAAWVGSTQIEEGGALNNFFSRGLMVYVTRCIVIQSMMQLAWWFDPLRGRVRVLFSRGLVVYVKHCTVIQSMLLGWVRATYVTRCTVIRSMHLTWVRPRSRARVRDFFSCGLVVYVTHCTVSQSMLLEWVRATSRQSEGLFQS